MSYFKISVCVFFLLILGISGGAQPGTLDASFGTGGKVITQVSASGDDYGSAMALQSDGKIVVAGLTYDGVSTKYQFALARYTTSGVLDNAFGIGGKVITPLYSGTGEDDEATSLVIQADGKIVAGGLSYNGTTSDYDFALVRYNSDGTLDNTFGTGGIVRTDLGDDNYAYCMALQSDGKIILCGTKYAANDFDFALVRYTTSGSPDAGFGTSGHVILPIITGMTDYITSIKIRPNGKIVLSGISFDSFNNKNRAVLVQLNTDGSIDTNFGTSGIVIANFSTAGDVINSIALLADGSIIAAGSTNGGQQMLLAKFTSTGAVDNSFGSAGVVSKSGYTANSVSIQPNGSILIGGNTSSGVSNFAVLRFNSDGTPDYTFGTASVVTTSFGTASYNFATVVGMQQDGKILLIGETSSGSKFNFALARYESVSNNPDGGLSDLEVPANKCGGIGVNQSAIVTLTNYSGTPVSTGQASVKLQWSGANTGSATVSNGTTIPPLGSASITINPINLQNAGINNFTATLTLSGDSITGNNTATATDTGYNNLILGFSMNSPSTNTYNFNSAVTGKPPYTYLWDFGDGSSTVTTQNATHHYFYIGTYTVKLKATDFCSSDSTTKSVNITVGIDDKTAYGELEIYPNPGNGSFQIKNSGEPERLMITISDVTGKTISEFEMNDRSQEFNTGLKAGVYLVAISGSHGTRVQRMVIN
jgi:uncharacterized delta-60 repeat protein